MQIRLDQVRRMGGRSRVRRGKQERCYRLGEEELTPEGRELVKRLTERARKG